MGNPSCNRFFIVGAPRSGTTLLQAMLNRHPDIAVPPETKVYCDFHDCSRSQRTKCESRLRSDFELPFDWTFPTATDQLLVSLQSEFLKTVGRIGVSWVGEKTPEHTSRLPQIRKDFPDAPIIAMVRNGFDVAASLTRVPWIRCGHGSGAIVWNYYMKHIGRSYKVDPNRFLLVSYEALCRDPISTLNQIYSLLKVDANFAESCVKPNPDRDRFLFPARELAWKSRALQPLQPAIFSDPVRSEVQHRQVRVACEPMLEHWGYIDANCPISASERFYWNAVNAFECARAVASLPRGRFASEVSTLSRSQFAKMLGIRAHTKGFSLSSKDGDLDLQNEGVVH